MTIRNDDLPDEPQHLPDLITDNDPPEVFDLPRQGIPKDLINLSKAALRMPELLVNE